MEVREKAAHGGGLSPVMSGEIHTSVVQRVVACLQVLMFKIYAHWHKSGKIGIIMQTKVISCSLLKITIVTLFVKYPPK